MKINFLKKNQLSTKLSNSKLKKLSIFKAFFSLISLPLLLLSFILCLIIPAHYSYIICFSIYGAIVFFEVNFGIYSPFTLSVFCSYFLIIINSIFFDEIISSKIYASQAVLIVLFFTSLVFLIKKRPITSFYSHNFSFKLLQNTINISTLIFITTAIILSFLLPQNLKIFMPSVFIFLASLTALLMSLVTFGPKWSRKKEFNYAGFVFREVHGPQAMESIVRFYSQEIMTALKRDRKNKTEHNIDDIYKEALAAEKRMAGPGHHYFEALDQGNVIGVVAVAIDHPGRLTPIEIAMGVTFDRLRPYGRIMEIRRLGIDKDYRFRFEVISGLFKCALDFGLENDVSFFTTYAFSFTQSMYDKVGFKPVVSHGKTGILFGSMMQPMVMNFAHSVLVQNGLNSNSTESFSRNFNPYLLDRWINRQTISQIWKPETDQSWSLSVDDIDRRVIPSNS